MSDSKETINPQASVLVDAQTDIKTAIKNGVLGNASQAALKDEVQKIIEKALSRIRSPTLRSDARVSLMRFSDTIYSGMRKSLRAIAPSALPYVCVLMREITGKDAKGETFSPATRAGKTAMQALVKMRAPLFQTYQNEIPLQEFTKTYIEKVRSALDELALSNAKDPNDFTGRNSLRNLAEMQIRYEAHQRSIEDLKSAGVRLVVCSAHADCSPRCAPWQGRVYSLDGTSGTTEDGRSFVPLEEATEVFYTTKAGRVYKNGLLGFNCRHFLTSYSPGKGAPFVTEQQRKEQYFVTQTQRRMERAVIEAREKALMLKGTDEELYKKWRRISIERNEAYKRFSISHKRAYFPDRVKIL